MKRRELKDQQKQGILIKKQGPHLLDNFESVKQEITAIHEEEGLQAHFHKEEDNEEGNLAKI